MIRENFWYKLFALLAAIGLWVYINSERNPGTSASVSVPLEVRNRIAAVEIGGLPEHVSVVLSGPKQQVETVEPDQVHAYVDLASRTPGSRSKLGVRVTLAPEVSRRVTAKPTVAQVTTTIEETVSRTFQVQASFVSPQPLGYSLGEPEVLPSTVLVTGARSVVASIKRLVAYVDTAGAAGTIDRFFPVVAIGAEGRRATGLRIEPPEVRVRVQLPEAPTQRTLLVSPTIAGLPNPPLRVKEVDTVPSMVTVTGKAERLAAIGTLTTDTIDISKATSSISRTVRIRAPAGVEVAGSDRVQVSIRIE